MSELSKDEQLDPLMKMRLALVAERRAAALAKDRGRVVAAQDSIESLDKAIADDAISPH